MTNLKKIRGNKTVRLILIIILIIVVAYFLYSIW